MEQTLKKRFFFATLAGNILEHYDKVLFSLVAPFIAPLYFPQSDPLVALILIYLPIGAIARPLGALYWGKIGDREGRKKVLFLSILGMSLTMIFTGLLPTYSSCGIASAALLHLSRGLTCFFAAGEGVSASLILIEGTKEKFRPLMSSYYEMSSMLGIFLASLVITWISSQDKIVVAWRFLFIVSGTIGLLSFWIRKNGLYQEIDEVIDRTEQTSFSWKRLFQENWKSLFAIIAMTGFCCTNYNILTYTLNSYIPLISKITKTEMMATHTLMVFIDFLLLPLFGLLAKKEGKEKVIFFSLILASLFAIPLFLLLTIPSPSRIFFVRTCLVLWGIAIGAPFNFWAMNLVPKRDRFRILALARAIGAQGIGAFSISLSLFIYKITHSPLAPAIVLTISGFIALFTFVLVEKKFFFEKN